MVRDPVICQACASSRLCEGDSGGPAPIEPSGGDGFGHCAGADWDIVFTNVSDYVSFVEKAVGKPCDRKQVDGLDVAQCW